jgi:1,2-dihydroxy-3-keto-5-methylthiopentene dioxygenase
MDATWLETGDPIASEALRSEGVWHEHLPVAEPEHRPRLQAFMRERGYVEQDVVELTPKTPGLDAICAKFVDEHLHDEDEVRFVLSGEGVFDIRSRDDRWMRVTVRPGDLIVVPEGRHHRFLLTERQTIRCVRLFKDRAGWVPHYRA